MAESVVGIIGRALASGPALAPALTDGREVLTYADLVRCVADEIDWLKSSGASRFALLAENGTGWVIADLALHLAGCLSVPLPAYFTDAQLQHALQDAQIDGLISDDPQRVTRLGDAWLGRGRSTASGCVLYTRACAFDAARAAPGGTVKITYTSGSTATPKGVCLAAAHIEAVAASLAEATAGLSIERHLCLLPLPTLLENIGGVYAPLIAGATCCVPPSREIGMSYGGLDVSRLLAAVSATRPASLILVPELLLVLTAAAERGWSVPSSLKFVAVGGATVAPSLLQRAEAVGLPVFEGYGLSECASVVALNTPAGRRTGSVGRPLPHARVTISDAGEILVACSTMLGYLGDASAAAQPELGTGDLGEFDADGYLYVRGRRRNLFITSLGRNIAPEWIERELSAQLPQRPLIVLGEARPYVIALISGVTSQDESARIDRAIAQANAQLPDYARVRGWVGIETAFSIANGLLTANGRVRRELILARYAELLEEHYRQAAVALPEEIT